jgi:phosphatidylglycerophosphatase A
MKNMHKHIATLFGLGYLLVAPGTAGSLAGLVLCLVLHGYPFLYAACFLALFTVGVISSGKVAAEARLTDPSYVIIDEFASIFVVFLFVPITVLTVIFGFALYRLFDIVKPPPIRLIEKARGGWGIMLDDLLAAIYANLILQAAVRIFNI